MSAQDTVTFYLHSKLRNQAEGGNHNFISRLSDVQEEAGLQVAFDGDDDLARARALVRPGRSLWLMEPPVNDCGLTFRKTYLYPFWHIEQQAARWDWPVAQEHFDPAAVPAIKAANFFRYWRERLFAEAPRHARRDGFVYVPLQGQLLRQRSFQSNSPVEMLKTVLARDPNRKVIATLHPSENYSDAEQRALEQILADNLRLTVTLNSDAQYLQNCDYVVTQNSSVGFMGYFFEKPLILFGKSDFHHIALRGQDPDAFDQVMRYQPNYAAYLYWFLQMKAINAGRPEVKQTIQTVLRGHGWPV
ncbi:capsular polysaccharide export protein, LipB/KpsS family [Loktanella sp. Alg231-35]|uniref:capsular polysaccharide export protein, LipB/KpsS family n=1 Tax=Loktanella sp. Alg231-35 TaxID=1922220 RepID=UPI000D551049|nr:hypothetical protein [Loktanella sp. Alg231-35]